MPSGALPLFLCMDQGGSASRALVFDARGQVLAAARVEVVHSRPLPGRVEQAPDEVVESLQVAAARAVAALDAGQRRRLQAAGLVCQRSSLMAWDADSGAALSPVLSWQDTRAADWLAVQALDADAVHARTGLYPNAHFGLSKLRWLLDHNDAVQRAAAHGCLRMGPLAAYLAFRLARGRPLQVDPANASRTLLMDLDRADWCQPMLDRFDIDRAWLPQITPSDADYGELSLHAATLPLRLLSGDQSAAAFAFGEPAAHTAYVNVGTGAFVYCLAGAEPTPPRLLRSVIHWSAQPQFVIEGTVNGAGSALAWFGARHGLGDAGADLDAHWPQDAAPPLFLNGIGGLGAPDWRPDFASRFVGEGGVAAQRIAVAESIVFLLKRNLERLQGASAPLTELLASGGLARSDRFCQSLADLAERPLQRPQDCEASARGSAFLLAGRPAQWPDLPRQSFMPQANQSLQVRYREWSELLEDALTRR